MREVLLYKINQYHSFGARPKSAGSFDFWNPEIAKSDSKSSVNSTQLVGVLVGVGLRIARPSPLLKELKLLDTLSVAITLSLELGVVLLVSNPEIT